MREDIETNLDKIIQDIDEDSYTECLHYYQQQKGIHEHRLDELGVETRTAVITTDDSVEQRLNEFKSFIDQTSGLLSSKAESGQ